MLLLAVSLLGAGARALPLVDTTGTGALVKGDCGRALAALARDSAVSDSSFWHFKQGVAYFNCQDYERAVTNLRCCVGDSSVLKGIALELIGDVESVRARFSVAATAYLSARRDSFPQAVLQDITEKTYALVKSHPELSASFPELAALAAEKKFLLEQTVDSITPAIDSLLNAGSWKKADSMLSACIDSTQAKRNARLIGLLASRTYPDSAFSTPLLFKVSRAAYACRDFPVADSFLVKAEYRKDLASAVPRKEFALLRGLVAYSCARYATAAKVLLEFEQRYGPTPEVVLALARSNRNLGNDTVAQLWYNRFVKLYPNHQSAPDVLWHLAWREEENDRFQKAAALYRKLTSLKRTFSRCDEAFFRQGLCWYKAGDYRRACSTFASFAKKFEDSWIAPGALYWKAKSLLGAGRIGEATTALCEVIRTAPTDFYAFRAREMLRLSADTACFPVIDSSRGIEATHRWIDSVCSPRLAALTRDDSLSFLRGGLLALCGLGDRAERFLDGLEMRYPSDLGLQFDVAFLFKYANDPTASFRAVRKLLWRLPPASRCAAPLQLMELLYPVPFSEWVFAAGGKNLVDPYLVLAVIRQESIFDAEALSRSGAIGLMQIMPFTGRSVAQKLGEFFTADSLLNPATNIRYGTFYLRELLDQFGGNTVLALASYNGGPPRATEWYAKNKQKTFDMFIEDIAFSETRSYVKKVLANYWTYRTFSDLRTRE